MPQNEEALHYWSEISAMVKGVGFGGIIDLSGMIKFAFELNPPLEHPYLCARKILTLAGVFIKQEKK